MNVFDGVPSECLVKVNGVEKVATCTKLSDDRKRMKVTNFIGSAVSAEKVTIEISGVKVHPITTMINVVVYNDIFEFSQQLFQMTQWDVNVKVPILEKKTDRVDENSTANANMTALVKSDVIGGIEYGSINFRVNAEILKHCSSF